MQKKHPISPSSATVLHSPASSNDHLPDIAMMWKARIVLSVVGQLIVVPAALFFMPTKYPKLFSATTADSPEDVSVTTFLEPTTDSTLLEDR